MFANFEINHLLLCSPFDNVCPFGIFFKLKKQVNFVKDLKLKLKLSSVYLNWRGARLSILFRQFSLNMWGWYHCQIWAAWEYLFSTGNQLRLEFHNLCWISKCSTSARKILDKPSKITSLERNMLQTKLTLWVIRTSS